MMAGFSGVDLAVFAVASFIAVVVLARLMRARRDQLLNQLREQMEQERHRKLAEQKRQKSVSKNSDRKAS